MGRESAVFLTAFRGAGVESVEAQFSVGIALVSLGTFWAAEGAGVHWPIGTVALLPIALIYLAGALAAVATLHRRDPAQTGGGR